MSDHPYRGVLPEPNEVDTPHWDGLRRHELLIQRCRECGHHVWYPGEACTACHRFALEWVPVDPVGEVWSYTTQFHRTGSKFDESIPFTSAIVRLRDAPEVTMGALLVDTEPDDVRIGLTVVGVWLDIPDVTLLRFRPGREDG